MNFSEKWGKNVEEAVKLALQDLKAEEDEVTVTVLEEPSKGFLGLGSKLAKVRVEKKGTKKEESFEEEGAAKTKAKKPDQDRASNKKREKPVPKQKETHNGAMPESTERITETAKVRPENLQPIEEHEAITFLKDTTEKMDISLDIKAFRNEECIYIEMEGKDAGTIIGKRGQTLDAIQYLTSLVVNKGKEKYIRVVLDAENYRAKREKTLEQLAKRLSDKVVRTRKSVRLEPMNPYERMVIHATLQSNQKVKTRSEGEEPYRRVIIEMK